MNRYDGQPGGAAGVEIPGRLARHRWEELRKPTPIMALQHYLPAAYIGLFSDEGGFPRRRRMLYAGERRKPKIIQAPAAKLGGIHDFYTMKAAASDPDMIDDVWSDYEQGLLEAIDQLIQGNISASTWARVMVPFVAGLLLRGPDFNIRFEGRIRSLGIDPSQDNTNQARILELQRLLGPVLVAQWIVTEVHGEAGLITNDLGFAPFVFGPTGERGISIPISHTHLLQIIPKRTRRIVRVRDDDWAPRIKYLELTADNHVAFNESAGRIAQRFIFGPTRHLVSSYLYQADGPPPVPEPAQVGFISGPLAVVHEFTWHRLVKAISTNPADDTQFDLDAQVLSEGWAPPIIFPTNLPEFEPCLTRKGNVIEATFYEVEGFTT